MQSLRVGEHTLTLDAGTSTIEPLFSDVWLGTELWPAARALVSVLEVERLAAVKSASRVLELGAGTGACGLAAAVPGARHVQLYSSPIYKALQ